MNHSNSELAYGTSGSPQITVENSEMEIKAEENEWEIYDESILLSELLSKNVKISLEKLVFITKDATGQIVWLEEGNSSPGLKHILSRHENDFATKHNVKKDDIENHLLNVFSSGKVEYNRKTIRNGKDGYERLYSYKGNYYLLCGIGTNGYIVSAYPIDENEAKKLIERYKK